MCRDRGARSIGDALRRCSCDRPSPAIAYGELLGGYSATGEPAFSYAMVSFSPPELSDLLCGTTEIRHVFS